jgi:hypothetical protein
MADCYNAAQSINVPTQNKKGDEVDEHRTGASSAVTRGACATGSSPADNPASVARIGGALPNRVAVQGS